MVYHGKVKNGQIVLDGNARLPEGADVHVNVEMNGDMHDAKTSGPTIWDKLAELAGQAQGLPADYSRNLDHYLYGAPKADE